MVGRQLPSAGLSVAQMLAGMSRLGLAPSQLKAPPKGGTPGLPGMTLYGIICRYLNSDLPPIVVSDQHAWVVVAWKREPSAGHDKLTLWRHDDAAGPYIRVDDPWNEPQRQHQPWASVIPPLLNKMYIDAERAENSGLIWLRSLARSGHFPLAADADAADALTFRTYAVRANDYKRRLSQRQMDPQLTRLYRLAHMPRYVWVVEAVDRRARDAGKPDVLGELLLDATMSEVTSLLDPGVLAVNLEATAFTTGPDYRVTRHVPLASAALYLSDLHVR